jgi:hypothetical protein
VRLAPKFADDCQRDAASGLDGLTRPIARCFSSPRDRRYGRIAPSVCSELVDTVLRESAFVYELRGRRLDQAREHQEGP